MTDDQTIIALGKLLAELRTERDESVASETKLREQVMGELADLHQALDTLLSVWERKCKHTVLAESQATASCCRELRALLTVCKKESAK